MSKKKRSEAVAAKAAAENAAKASANVTNVPQDAVQESPKDDIEAAQANSSRQQQEEAESPAGRKFRDDVPTETLLELGARAVATIQDELVGINKLLDQLGDIVAELEYRCQDKPKPKTPELLFFYLDAQGEKQVTKSLSDAFRYTSSPKDVYCEWCWLRHEEDDVESYVRLNALERRKFVSSQMATEEAAAIAELERHQ